MPRLVATALLLLAALLARDAAAQAVCNGQGTGGCLTPHLSPGCSDARCCASVCDLYPPCCIITWDEQCVDIANQACIGLCGAAINGPCSLAHPTPSCADADCCNAVCQLVPSCCQFVWDDICVIIASQNCTLPPPAECGQPGQGSCTETHPTPGCSNGSCCETVCAYRAECCSFAWDSICVTFAEAYCAGCTLPCPEGSVPELEQCGARTNQHCGAGQSPQPIADGSTVCGQLDGSGTSTSWAGDLDGYSLTLTDPDGDGKVRLILGFTSNSPAFVALVPATCPATTASSPFHANSSACVLTEASECVPPGNYVLRVAPGNFPNAGSVTTYSCDLPLRYTLSVATSQDGCEPVCETATGPCFDAHGGVGCQVQACCEAACSVDPVCCEKIWDVECARLAAVGCGLPIPANDDCAAALPVAPGTPINLSTIRATVSQPALPASCDTGGGLGIGPDVWYRYNGERSGTVSVSTCGSPTDMRLAVYSGSCGALTLVACNSSSPVCSPNTGARLQFLAACGTDYYIRVAGEIASRAGSATLSVTASGPICPAFCPSDLNRDGTVSGADLGLLLGNWGLFGQGDLDLDGTIGGSDLGLLLGAWGNCPAPPP